MSQLFSPLSIRGIEFKNRIFVSPMCQYSSEDGNPTDWHLVHLGSRAVGGAALVIAEATAVSPEGRISPQDIGIWSDQHIPAFQKITKFIKQQGSVPGIQLAHAGRKAGTKAPWKGGGPLEDPAEQWQTIAPSAIPFDSNYPLPKEMTTDDMQILQRQFESATKRALKSGFELIELHMAHGYLMHEFLSPLSNKRSDEFGGNLDNRMRYPLEITKAIRETLPDHFPLLVRISATDWVDDGWDLSQSVQFSRKLQKIGIDLIDCSSGGILPEIKIPATVGYQTHFATEIRKKTGIKTGAVGKITSPQQAEHIITTGQADAVILGREFLRHPYWPLHAARDLGIDLSWPRQYQRAKIK